MKQTDLDRYTVLFAGACIVLALSIIGYTYLTQPPDENTYFLYNYSVSGELVTLHVAEFGRDNMTFTITDTHLNVTSSTIQGELTNQSMIKILKEKGDIVKVEVIYM